MPPYAGEPGMPSAVPPACPRHPDRLSRVSCQRCGRPACPACLREAPVGYQCVDCVAEAARSMPVQRTSLGLPAPSDGRPLVTYTIIGICVALYAAQLISPAVTSELAFAPFLGWSEPWRALSAAFLHSPSMVLHIALNMLFLYQIGPMLELTLGRARFLALYVLSALGGSAGVVLLASAPTRVLGGAAEAAAYQSWVTGVVGASGAVFGLFGALVLINRSFGRSSAPLYVVLAVNLVIGFLPGISWQTHLGGLVTGVAVAGAILATRAPERRRWQWPLLALILAVLIGACVAKYLTVPVFYR